MENKNDKRVQLLQYINTGILTLILGVSIMVAGIVNDVKQSQVTQDSRIVKVETVQNINTTNITVLDDRVRSLEDKYATDIKEWVEANYVRKAQK